MLAHSIHDICEVQLDALPSETVKSAQLRENGAFDEMAAPFARNLALFRSGRFGRP